MQMRRKSRRLSALARGLLKALLLGRQIHSTRTCAFVQAFALPRVWLIAGLKPFITIIVQSVQESSRRASATAKRATLEYIKTSVRENETITLRAKTQKQKICDTNF